MSLEKNIERIADALEGLLAIAKDEGVVAKKAPTKKLATPGTEDVGPGAEDVGPGVETESGIKTSGELRDLAQKYIQVAGDKTGTLVTFIQSVAKIFNPKEPKLIKIPVEKVAEAAKMIEDWCKKNAIALPIEV